MPTSRSTRNEHVQIQGGVGGGGGRTQKYRVSLQYWSRSPEKSQSYKARIQCWAIIGQPAKRNLNGVSLAAR